MLKFEPQNNLEILSITFAKGEHLEQTYKGTLQICHNATCRCENIDFNFSGISEQDSEKLNDTKLNVFEKTVFNEGRYNPHLSNSISQIL